MKEHILFSENSDAKEEMTLNIKWLWVAMMGGSVLLATPGNSSILGMLGDVLGHFFSAFLLALIPIAGYYLLYKKISEKEITYLFGAAWAFLVISQFLSP